MGLNENGENNYEAQNQWIWEKLDIELLIDTKIEKKILEIFQVFWLRESLEMKELRQQMMWGDIDFNALYEKYKQIEQELQGCSMKSQVCVLLVKVFYFSKNGKYTQALQEFDNIWEYLSNLPDLTDQEFDLFQELYSEIKNRIQ